MTNAALVARKLAVLEEHLRRLSERRPSDPAELRASTLLQDALSISVLVVVQEAMDIGLHIASDEGWELSPTYRETFTVLAQHGVIRHSLAVTLGQAAPLRNRIAHGDATLDVDRLWADLPLGQDAFAQFAEAIARHLAQAPPEG